MILFQFAGRGHCCRVRSFGRSRLALAVVFLTFGCLLSGCVTDDLSTVHNVYRDEFSSQDLKLGVAQDQQSVGAPGKSTSRFPRTLAAIQGFRARHQSSTNAIKHLAVLEAMVHLQSGQYGMARLATRSAAELAGSLETSDGELIRDQILLQSLQSQDGLIDAWEIMSDTARWDVARLDRIGKNLCDMAARFQAPDGDDGRLYVAATAAIAYIHAGTKHSQDSVASSRPQSEKDAAAAPYFQKAAAALKPYLSKVDNALDVTVAGIPNTKPVARYQFISIYRIAQSK